VLPNSHHTFQVLQSGITAWRLLLSGTLAHFPVLERRRDPTPGSLFGLFKSAFAFWTSFFDSRTTSASFAFTRCLISRASPVLGMSMPSLAHSSIRFIGASLCVALGASRHLDRSFGYEDSPVPESMKPSDPYRTVSGRRFVDSGPALFWGVEFLPLALPSPVNPEFGFS